MLRLALCRRSHNNIRLPVKLSGHILKAVSLYRFLSAIDSFPQFFGPYLYFLQRRNIALSLGALIYHVKEHGGVLWV
ncbi:hypothetical protein O5623_30520 [Escherichia coli]|nr:hypothetical protein [Escherichia coli]